MTSQMTTHVAKVQPRPHDLMCCIAGSTECGEFEGDEWDPVFA
jgi:hypothetical protein